MERLCVGVVVVALAAAFVGLASGQTCDCVFQPPRDCELVTLQTVDPQTCVSQTSQCTNCICSQGGSFTCNVVGNTQRLFFTDETQTVCATEFVQGVACPSDGIATVSCFNDQQMPWGGFNCVIDFDVFPSGVTVTAGELGILQSSNATLTLINEQTQEVTGTVTVSLINEITTDPTYFTTLWPNESTAPLTTTLPAGSQTTVTASQTAEDAVLIADTPLLTALNAIIAAQAGSVTVTFDVSFEQTIGSFEGGVDEAFSTASFLFAFAYTP
mmetsp:Transcript_14382/g.30973  ORF Transcript_14382/g.30973 Transcript_14382/m.30973 type:complete len:271 (+) Transcript_14382:85-897(+)